jgi:outer membrane protein OmpA-like peptidoglycan-associated protein
MTRALPLLALLALAACNTSHTHSGVPLEYPGHVKRGVGAPGGQSTLGIVLSRDVDEDGIPDVRDNCPNEAGVAENYGCKDPQLVVLRADRIEILDKVYFTSGSDYVDPRSYKLLENIARVLKGHDEITRLTVEGHTDDSGEESANISLSQQRAEAVVKYLVAQGVAESRLVAKGLGSTQPLEPNDTQEGRAANRRVQFVIGF